MTDLKKLKNEINEGLKTMAILARQGKWREKQQLWEDIKGQIRHYQILAEENTDIDERPENLMPEEREYLEAGV